MHAIVANATKSPIFHLECQRDSPTEMNIIIYCKKTLDKKQMQSYFTI